MCCWSWALEASWCWGQHGASVAMETGGRPQSIGLGSSQLLSVSSCPKEPPMFDLFKVIEWASGRTRMAGPRQPSVQKYHLISLCLNLPIYKTGMTVALKPLGCHESS